MIGQNEPLQLFRNDGGNQHGWITLRLAGVHGNRDALGAEGVMQAGRRARAEARKWKAAFS